MGTVDSSSLARLESLTGQPAAKSPRVGKPETWSPRALLEARAETPAYRTPMLPSPLGPRAWPATDRTASVGQVAPAAGRVSTTRLDIGDSRATKTAWPPGSGFRPGLIRSTCPIVRPSEPRVARQTPVWVRRVPRCGRGTSVPPPYGDVDKQRPPIRRQSTAGLGRVGVALDRFPAEGDDGPPGFVSKR